MASPALHRWRGLALPGVKAMAFHIIGDKGTDAIKAIRLLPASAAVLAMKWVAQAVEGVRIEIDGRSYGPDAFRREFLRRHATPREAGTPRAGRNRHRGVRRR